MEFWENSDLVLVKGKKYRMKLGMVCRYTNLLIHFWQLTSQLHDKKIPFCFLPRAVVFSGSHFLGT